MKFNERLISALKSANKNQSELASHLQLTPQAVQQWCSPNGTMPRSRRIELIAEFLNVSYAWLATGETASKGHGHIAKTKADYNTTSKSGNRDSIKEKLELLSINDKRRINKMTIAQMQQQLENLDNDRLRVIESILESWHIKT